MEKPSRVYVTYIATTPEKLWDALTDPDQTEQYWAHHRNISTWEVGATWEHLKADGEVQVVGEIKEIDPPKRLVHTFANESRKDDPEYYTTVAYDIEPAGDAVCLTITHTDLNDEILSGIEGGWPMVIAALKTHLETDAPLAIWDSPKATA
jgi:uncharacterized protein YndB with AHSA1/START domain